VASKKWHETLKSTILEIGYQQAPTERCLFFHRCEEGELTLLLTYVDDVLIASESEDFMDRTIETLRQNYKIKVMQDPKNFVGLQITRDRDRKETRISQSRYISRMAEVYGLDGESRFMTPMETNLQIDKSHTPNDDTEFRGLIGASLYVARHSRPDISFAVNKLSQHQGYVTMKSRPMPEESSVTFSIPEVSNWCIPTVTLIHCEPS